MSFLIDGSLLHRTGHAVVRVRLWLRLGPHDGRRQA